MNIKTDASCCANRDAQWHRQPQAGGWQVCREKFRYFGLGHHFGDDLYRSIYIGGVM
jgi:hypothetical protein